MPCDVWVTVFVVGAEVDVDVNHVQRCFPGRPELAPPLAICVIPKVAMHIARLVELRQAVLAGLPGYTNSLLARR